MHLMESTDYMSSMFSWSKGLGFRISPMQNIIYMYICNVGAQYAEHKSEVVMISGITAELMSPSQDRYELTVLYIGIEAETFSSNYTSHRKLNTDTARKMQLAHH